MLELISAKICPFVQRSIITMKLKNVPVKITHIDLADKPDWFLEISPFGKVPVLRVGDTVLFESAVINEYLDETNEPQLHPNDPLARAHNRAWIEFGSSLLMSQYGLFVAKDEDSWTARLEETNAKLARLEAALGEGPFFNGQHFSLVDAAVAPAFMRFDIVSRATGLNFFGETPKLAAWSKAVLAMDAVKQSVVEDFDQLVLTYFQKHESYWVSLVS